MPRIRTVKPEHWGDKALPDISLQAHLLWIGMWNFSDDKGVIENDPYYIKSQVFPRRKEVRVEQIEQWIDQLIKARFLVPFTFNGVSYCVSRSFVNHQKIDRATPSKIPQEFINQILKEYSTTTRLQLDEGSTITRSVEYSNVEYKVEESSAENVGSTETPKTENEIAFDKFQAWLNSNAPNVAKMKEPFSLDQFISLKSKIEPNVIMELCLKMHNWKDLNKKNINANLTFKNWYNRDYGNK